MHDSEVGEFVEREYVRLVRAVTLFCGSVEVAEDSVQEALSKALDRATKPNDVESTALWVTTVAFNRARRWFRRSRMEDDLRQSPRIAGAPQHAEPSAEALDVRRAVLRLPTRQREVVVLHYFLGFSVAGIAHRLSISSSATKNALHKARASLANELGVGYTTGEIDVQS